MHGSLSNFVQLVGKLAYKQYEDDSVFHYDLKQKALDDHVNQALTRT